jgi:hypothetical protein
VETDMNERIGKLRLQACKWASENVPIGEYENASDEKFAELIVKECAQVAFEGDLKRAIGQWGSHSDILKHFEVEHDVVKTFRS